MKKIEFLYFEDCPSYKETLVNLQEALAELKMEAEIIMIDVDSPEKAEEVGFLGSPTIVIDGVDLEGRTGGFAFNCRIYELDGKLKGVPSKEFIAERLVNPVPVIGGGEDSAAPNADDCCSQAKAE